jgi:hypothetical protein
MQRVAVAEWYLQGHMAAYLITKGVFETKKVKILSHYKKTLLRWFGERFRSHN